MLAALVNVRGLNTHAHFLCRDYLCFAGPITHPYSSGHCIFANNNQVQALADDQRNWWEGSKNKSHGGCCLNKRSIEPNRTRATSVLTQQNVAPVTYQIAAQNVQNQQIRNGLDV